MKLDVSIMLLMLPNVLALFAVAGFVGTGRQPATLILVFRRGA